MRTPARSRSVAGELELCCPAGVPTNRWTVGGVGSGGGRPHSAPRPGASTAGLGHRPGGPLAAREREHGDERGQTGAVIRAPATGVVDRGNARSPRDALRGPLHGAAPVAPGARTWEPLLVAAWLRRTTRVQRHSSRIGLPRPPSAKHRQEAKDRKRRQLTRPSGSAPRAYRSVARNRRPASPPPSRRRAGPAAPASSTSASDSRRPKTTSFQRNMSASGWSGG